MPKARRLTLWLREDRRRPGATFPGIPSRPNGGNFVGSESTAVNGNFVDEAVEAAGVRGDRHITNRRADVAGVNEWSAPKPGWKAVEKKSAICAVVYQRDMAPFIRLNGGSAQDLVGVVNPTLQS